MRGAGAWVRANPGTRGHRLTDDERRRLAVGLRFPTGLRPGLVVVALALRSAVAVCALRGVGLVAGFASRHPFDRRYLRLPSETFARPQRRRTSAKPITT